MIRQELAPGAASQHLTYTSLQRMGPFSLGEHHQVIAFACDVVFEKRRCISLPISKVET